MRLYTFTNTRFTPLETRFKATLKDNFDVVCLKDNFETDGAVAGGLAVWKYKPEKLIEAIQKNWGQVIVFSDINIQFFKKTQPLIERHITQNDIVF